MQKEKLVGGVGQEKHHIGQDHQSPDLENNSRFDSFVKIVLSALIRVIIEQEWMKREEEVDCELDGLMV